MGMKLARILTFSALLGLTLAACAPRYSVVDLNDEFNSTSSRIFNEKRCEWLKEMDFEKYLNSNTCRIYREE